MLTQCVKVSTYFCPGSQESIPIDSFSLFILGDRDIATDDDLSFEIAQPDWVKTSDQRIPKGADIMAGFATTAGEDNKFHSSS